MTDSPDQVVAPKKKFFEFLKSRRVLAYTGAGILSIIAVGATLDRYNTSRGNLTFTEEDSPEDD